MSHRDPDCPSSPALSSGVRTNSLRRCFWQGVCGVWGVSSQQARAKRAGAEPARRCPWSGEAGAGPATCAPAGLPLCSHLPAEGLARTGRIPRPRASGRLTGPFPGLPAAVQMPSSCPHIGGRESRLAGETHGRHCHRVFIQQTFNDDLRVQGLGLLQGAGGGAGLLQGPLCGVDSPGERVHLPGGKMQRWVWDKG